MERVVTGTVLALVGVLGEILAKGFMYYLHFSGLHMSSDPMLAVLTFDTTMFALILFGLYLIWADMKPVLRDAF